MNKIITYVADISAFKEELEQLAPQYTEINEETGVKSSKLLITPTVKNEAGSLNLSLLSDSELELLITMTTVEVLGTYSQLFANEASLARYKSVYPYDTPTILTDEAGVEYEYFRSKRIGDFAGVPDITVVEELTSKQEKYKLKIKERFQVQASALNFDSIETAGKYTGFANPFQTEAETLLGWVAATWATVETLQLQHASGEREFPSTWEELEKLLPVLDLK